MFLDLLQEGYKTRSSHSFFELFILFFKKNFPPSFTTIDYNY